MASRFEFESPGAAFTGTIAQVLTQRKAEERQRLLDSLQFTAEQRAEQEAQRQAERDAQSIAASKAQMASQQLHDEMAKAGALAAPRRMGDNPEEIGYAPEDVDLLRKYGYIKDVPVPQVSTGSETFTDEQGVPAEGPAAAPVATPAPKMRPSFVGSQQEQADEEDKRNSAMLISQLLQDEKTKPLGMSLMHMAEANNGKIPKEANQLLEPNAPVYVWNEGTGRVEASNQNLPPNAKVVTQPRPYRDYAQRQWIATRNVGPNGGQILFDPNSGETREMPGTASMPGGGVPQGLQTLGISQGTFDAHDAAVAMMGDDASDDGTVTPGLMDHFRTTASRMIEGAKVTGNVAHLAKLYVNDPAAYKAAIVNGSVQLSPQEIDQLDRLKHAVAPSNFVEELIIRNPVRSFKKPAGKPATAPKSQSENTGGQTIQNLMTANGGMS